MSDFSVRNYVPHNMYYDYGYNYSNYPSFKGKALSNDSTQTQNNNTPQITQQPDSVSFSANEQLQKQGMSTGAKIAVGAGIVSTIAVITALICLHKGGKALEGQETSLREKLEAGWKKLWGKDVHGENNKPSGTNKPKPETPNPETTKPEEIKPEVAKPETVKVEEKARIEAEKAAREAEEKARIEAEKVARETEEKARLEAEKAAREAEEKARIEAEKVARETEEKVRLEAEKAKKDAELKAFAESIPNLSRSELAKIRYELTHFGCELDMLELASKKRLLNAEEQLRLNYLNDKLKLVTEQENKIENALMAYNPADTVSKNSAISKHHEANGFNHLVRRAVEDRANDLKGLTEIETENLLRTEKSMMEIDKEFEQLPPLAHDCIVYKGIGENPILESFNIPFKIIGNAKVGDIVVPDTAYTYTAFNRSIAEHWGGEGGRMSGKRIMMFEIHLPKGAKVSRNMEHKGEVLMPRGAQYKVIDKKVAENGDIEATLEYILPKASS